MFVRVALLHTVYLMAAPGTKTLSPYAETAEGGPASRLAMPSVGDATQGVDHESSESGRDMETC